MTEHECEIFKEMKEDLNEEDNIFFHKHEKEGIDWHITVDTGEFFCSIYRLKYCPWCGEELK